MDRSREGSITVDTLSLEQLGSLLAKFSDSVNREMPSKNPYQKSLERASKYCHDQPVKSTHGLSANKPQKAVEGGKNERKEETQVPQGLVEIPRQEGDARLCVLLRKKTLERALLLLLITAVSVAVILPFCLTVGANIYERSSEGFDFIYNEACDSVSIAKYVAICIIEREKEIAHHLGFPMQLCVVSYQEYTTASM